MELYTIHPLLYDRYIPDTRSKHIIGDISNVIGRNMVCFGSNLFRALSSLLSLLRSFCQIDTNQDLGSLPKLHQIDDIFQRADREAHSSHQLWPTEVQEDRRLQAQ